MEEVGIHLGVEEPVMPASAPLGGIQGRVGVADQRLGVLAIVRIHRNAHGNTGFHGAQFQHDRFGHGTQQAVAKFGQFILVLGLGPHDQKFIACLPTQGIRLSQATFQPGRHYLEYLIAHRVPMAIVDKFEIVEIEAENREFAPVLMGEVQGLLQTLPPQQTVGQPRQRVVIGEELDLLLSLLELGNIGEQAHVAQQLAVLIHDTGYRQPLGINFAILATIPDFALPAAFGLQAGPEVLIKPLGLHLGVQQPHVPAQGLLGGVAGDGGKGRVDQDDVAVRIGDHDGLRALVEYRLRQQQFLLLLAQDSILFMKLSGARIHFGFETVIKLLKSQLGQRPLGHVVQRDHQAENLALLVKFRLAGHMVVSRHPRRRGFAQFELDGFSGEGAQQVG